MRILIADDSIVSRHLLDATLRKWGYEVVVACDGVEAWNVLQSEDAPNLAILDWVMPGLTGPEVCRRVRERVKEVKEKDTYTYILLLTSKSLKEDLIEGMEAGADDYVTKPFKAAELIARIEVLLRRVPVRSGHGVHQFGPIQVDVGRATVTRDGKPVYLSAREFQLLRYFIERAGSTLPRSELLRSIWGYAENTLTRTVDMHVASLREKLEQNPKRPELIVTVAGVGYRFLGARSS